MEKHRDLATNKLVGTQYKDKSNSLWNDLTTQLNAEGPPVRNSDGWKKVWKDLKYYTSCKLTFNINGKNKTGGGKFKEKIITALEERIIGICKLRTRAEGINYSNSFGIEMDVPIISRSEIQTTSVTTIPNIEDSENIDELYPIVEDMTSNSINETDTTRTVWSQRNRQHRKENTPNNLLKKQIENQSEFNKSFKNFNTEKIRLLKDVRNELKSIRKVKEKEIIENLKFKQREEKRVEELHKIKLEIKKMELQKLKEIN